MNAVNNMKSSAGDRAKEIAEDFYACVKAREGAGIFIGDYDAALSAIQRPANATNRHVTLPRLLAQSINTKALQ